MAEKGKGERRKRLNTVGLDRRGATQSTVGAYRPPNPLEVLPAPEANQETFHPTKPHHEPQLEPERPVEQGDLEEARGRKG